jgi:hypothetical protein
MKREIFYYAVLLFIIAGLIFIETNTNDKSDVNISKVIDVESFQRLDIDLICNIYVSIGDEQRVVLEGPENYLNQIETKFENGVLKLTEKAPGIFKSLLGRSDGHQINLYLKLTSADQLIKSTKSTLITNESSLKSLLEEQQLSLNQHLLGILKLVGNQTGFIRQIAL